MSNYYNALTEAGLLLVGDSNHLSRDLVAEISSVVPLATLVI